MLDLDRLNELANQTVERIRRDRLEDDKILIHIDAIISEAVRQHAAWYGKMEQLQDSYNRLREENALLEHNNQLLQNEVLKHRKQAHNRCVCCGAIVPEGRQVCPGCEGKEKP